MVNTGSTSSCNPMYRAGRTKSTSTPWPAWPIFMVLWWYLDRLDRWGIKLLCRRSPAGKREAVVHRCGRDQILHGGYDLYGHKLAEIRDYWYTDETLHYSPTEDKSAVTDSRRSHNIFISWTMKFYLFMVTPTIPSYPKRLLGESIYSTHLVQALVPPWPGDPKSPVLPL